MIWDDILAGIIQLLFQVLAAAASIVLVPVDLLINGLFPAAQSVVYDFFQWLINTVSLAESFLVWFFYVIGITPATWSVIAISFQVVLFIFIVLLPFKVVMSIFKGMR